MAFKRIKGMISDTDPRVAQVGHPGPPWMISYADLMTELVCFFVILYALSASLDKNTQSAGKAAEEAGKEAGMKVETTVTKDGLFISVEEQQDKALFASGKSELSPEANVIIDKLVPILKTFKYDIEVQGHTDNIPVGGSAFSSNWELSTARATSVVRYLIDRHQFEPPRMGAMGYGEFRPIAPNDTPENRAKNRRVVFFLKTTVIGDKAKGKQEGLEGSNVPHAAPEPAPAPEPVKPAEPAAAPAPAAKPQDRPPVFQTVGPKPPVEASVPLVETPKKSAVPPNTFTFPTGAPVATPVKSTLKKPEATIQKPAVAPAANLSLKPAPPVTATLAPKSGLKPAAPVPAAPADKKPAVQPAVKLSLKTAPPAALSLTPTAEPPKKVSPPVTPTAAPAQKPLELPPGISP